MTDHERRESEDAAVAQRALGLLDLTSLGDDDVAETVRVLCGDATTRHGSVAAVCVWPRFVSLAAGQLAGTRVKVAAVANFPEGIGEVEEVVVEALRIVSDGADEVDVVYPWRSQLSDGPAEGEALVAAVSDAIGEQATLKVILETGELPDEASIRSAARAAIRGGAGFLKTSTGKTAHGASLSAARILLEAIRDCGRDDESLGIKISGGVRDLATAKSYLDLADEIMGREWARAATFRFGASGLLTDLVGVIDATQERPNLG